MATVTAASESAIPTATSILPWSSLLCNHVQEGPETSNLQILYNAHHQSSSNSTVQRCSWFVQAKKAQETRLLKEHVKQENELAKQQRKEEEEARITKKRAEGFTCRRCSVKFDSNTKLHEHIRTRHAKKPKRQSVQSTQPVSHKHISSPSTTTSVALTTSPPTSPKLIVKLPATPLFIRSTTPRPSRIPKLHLIMNDLFRIFAGKPKPLSLQQRQNKSLSRYSNSCQTRITSYFNAVASPTSKSSKFPAHVSRLPANHSGH